MSNFVHLSVRSDMSGTQRSLLGDFTGSAKVEEYVAKAAEMGQRAIAITDLGTMRNVYALKVACDKHGIKPIYGVEVYVCQDHTKKDVPKELVEEITKNISPSKYREVVDEYAAGNGYTRGEKDLSTLTLWAMNDEGLKNLFRLTTKSWTDGFYYKPRVDVAMLKEFSAGVACGTGGPNSWVHKPNLSGRRREAIERTRALFAIFDENLVFEYRPHRLLEQEVCNSFCDELMVVVSDAPWSLVTQGAHYLNKGGLDSQKMICAIGTGRGSELSSCGLEIDSYWLRSEGEMIEAILASELTAHEDSAKALCDASMHFANACKADFNLDPFAMIIPDIDTGELSHIEYLEKLCDDSDRWVDGSMPDPNCEYTVRLAKELEELARPVSPDSEATFASYIVYVNEVVQMCRDLGIALGPGRGSAAGSIVNWLLGITDVDPVEHGLMFSRFISPNRIGPPDVDIDVDPSKRGLLFEKMRERWGAESVAQISTFSKFKGRVVVNDVCRELKVPIPETQAITKHIEQRSDFEDGAFDTVRDAFIGSDDHPAISDCVAFAQKHPAVVPYALGLEGKMRNLGVHPAGIVCAPKSLSEYIPLETRSAKDSDDRILVTAFDMIGVEQCGLLKVDMLGLITVNVISNALNKVNENLTKPLTMSNIPLDDAATLKAFEDRDFSGVFQFDSGPAKQLCKGVTFPSFSTISDMTALNRPGPLDSGMAEEYKKRKADPSLVQMDYCEKVSEITQDTLGVMIYQEQVMQVCGEVGLHENPDVMRKIIGKKKMDKIEAERPGFIKGAAQSSPEMSEETANKLYDDICTFGRYGFNKSHSVAYAKIGYLCQYLKVHHPLEFYWAMMLSASNHGKTDKMRQYAKEANARGIRVLPPNVQKSGFSLDIDREKNAIIGALIDIKKVGEKAAKSIVQNQPFDSFADFMERVNTRSVNMGCITALARAGAMDDLLPNVKQFVLNAPELFKKKNNKSFPGWEEAVDSLEGPDYTADEKVFEASEVNPMALENPFTNLLESLSVEVLSFENPDFLSERHGEHVWVSGVIRESKIYQDTGFGDRQLTEAEKEHESYGKSYMTCSLEADSGKALKTKIPPHVFDNCKNFVGDDEPVLMLARVDDQYSNKLRARFVLSLRQMKMGEAGPSAKLVQKGEHPVHHFKGLSPSNEGYANQDNAKRKLMLHRGTFDALPIIGEVVSIRTKLAGKKLQEMGWLGIISADGEYTEVTVFSGDWIGGVHFGREKVGMKGQIGIGSIIRIDVTSNHFNGRFSCQYNGHGMEILA